jgi:sulfatase modifying factor 1
VAIPGGEFPEGRGTAAGSSDAYPTGGADETPEFPSSVSTFALDKYEVTVGRFRAFVSTYVSNTASAPAAGAGAHPSIAKSGWQSDWNAMLPKDRSTFMASLKCSSTIPETWSDSPGAGENKAINCLSWYEAFAFCIWDGGRLPTESELEYAAAGGSDNRLYPWGSGAPSCTRASYQPCAIMVRDVGTSTAGAGRWGQLDLAGNVSEWALDWYAAYPVGPVADYAVVDPGTSRIHRGGSVRSLAGDLRAAFRYMSLPGGHYDDTGVRCARGAP